MPKCLPPYMSNPGLQTPDDALLDELLAAYAKADDEGGLRWHLRGSEAAASHSADLREMRALLESFANTLQYRQELNAEAVTWRDEEGNTLYTFSRSPLRSSPPCCKACSFAGQESGRHPWLQNQPPRVLNLRRPKPGQPGWPGLAIHALSAAARLKNPLLSRELFLSQVSNMSPNDPTEQMALF